MCARGRKPVRDPGSALRQRITVAEKGFETQTMRHTFFSKEGEEKAGRGKKTCVGESSEVKQFNEELTIIRAATKGKNSDIRGSGSGGGGRTFI